mmetsp:Transcript_2121/g.8444  ORF Transcript_2121/g.8444 Transcript_2121/m.8444 type:complete len:109 (-) Transcript_2121:29-355(-)
MDAAALAAFEARAADAERRLAALEIGGAGEAAAGGAGAPGASVDELWALRKLLGKARAEYYMVRTERDEVASIVSGLAAKNAALQYQVLHLTRAVKEADAKLAEAGAS